MKRFAVVSKITGEILRTGTCAERDLAIQAGGGEEAREADEHVRDDTHAYHPESKSFVRSEKPASERPLKNPDPLAEFRDRLRALEATVEGMRKGAIR